MTSKRHKQRILFVSLFALIGTTLLIQSFAAISPQAKITEAENGTTNSNVTIVSDASASASSYLQFDSSSTNNGGVAVCPPTPAFPDASCTGWQHTGITLKSVPGQVTSGTGWNWEGSPLNYVKITGNNVVLDGLDINGCVYVDVGVTSATIKRTRITGNCDYLVRLYDTNTNIAVNFTDVELVGGAVQMKGTGYTWLRVNSWNFTGKAAMTGSNTLIEDSYVHDQRCNPPDHQSGIGTNGGATNVIMRHNNIDLTPSECTSGGIANYDDFGAFHTILIEKNLINSGGYCLKAGFEDNNAAGNSGMQVLNNVFGRKYFPECGNVGSGIVSSWMASVSGNVWSGNTWGGGSAATASHVIGDIVNP